MFHTSYYDEGFRWHPQYDVDYGHPLGDAVESKGKKGQTVVYERNYTKCSVRVVCAAGESVCNAHLEME